MSETGTVYEAVKKKIFSGDFHPGAPVIDRKIAQELGVSRSPVRESLAVLVGQGLLERAGKGQSVKMPSYTPDDIRQMYEYRKLLEGKAAASAADLATETEVAGLAVLCEAMRSAVTEHDEERFGELSYKFHCTVAMASHNKWLSKALKSLLLECKYLFYVYPIDVYVFKEAFEESSDSLDEDLLGSITDEHWGIHQAIKSRDRDEARSLVEKLLTSGSERLIAAALKRGLLSE